MAKPAESFLDRLLQRRVLRRWISVADMADTMGPATLRQLRNRAREVRTEIDRALFAAEARLQRPSFSGDEITRPMHCDWAWRPDVWRGPVRPAGVAGAPGRTPFGSGVTVFHDCKTSELTMRQLPNLRRDDAAPFGLSLEVFGFDGTFLSVVIDLPDDAVQDLRLRHLIRLEAQIDAERPLRCFARLNVKHGPNTAQLLRELPLAGELAVVEFDLAYSKMNEKRVEKAWVDLIFEDPQMNHIRLRDLTLTRRPRAEI